MGEHLPSIQITPAMAVRFARKIRLKTTSTDAEKWLTRNKKEIERRLGQAAQSAIEDVLNEVTLWEWPEPAFDTIYRQVERAVDEAIEEYEEKHHVEISSQTVREKDMRKVVCSFLRHKGPKRKRAWLVVSISFKHSEDRNTDNDENRYLFEIIYKDGHVCGAVPEPVT